MMLINYSANNKSSVEFRTKVYLIITIHGDLMAHKEI